MQNVHYFYIIIITTTRDNYTYHWHLFKKSQRNKINQNFFKYWSSQQKEKSAIAGIDFYKN